MATRSKIGYFNPETNLVESIYCHWDGYLDGVGETLKNHYSNDEVIQSLISYGSMSILESRIHPKRFLDYQHIWNPKTNEMHPDIKKGKKRHCYEHPHIDTCVFHLRDRNEDSGGEPDITEHKLEDYLEQSKLEYGCEYAYVFKDGQWYYNICYRPFEDWKKV